MFNVSSSVTLETDCLQRVRSRPNEICLLSRIFLNMAAMNKNDSLKIELPVREVGPVSPLPVDVRQRWMDWSGGESSPVGSPQPKKLEMSDVQEKLRRATERRRVGGANHRTEFASFHSFVPLHTYRATGQISYNLTSLWFALQERQARIVQRAVRRTPSLNSRRRQEHRHAKAKALKVNTNAIHAPTLIMWQ